MYAGRIEAKGFYLDRPIRLDDRPEVERHGSLRRIEQAHPLEGCLVSHRKAVDLQAKVREGAEERQINVGEVYLRPYVFVDLFLDGGYDLVFKKIRYKHCRQHD